MLDKPALMRRLATFLLTWLSGLVACSGSCADAKLREGGPTPYMRCLAGPAPSQRTGRAGDVSFVLQGRTLELTPQRWPLRVAAFSGAGFGAPLRSADLARIKQLDADLVLMLGGLGESEASAQTNAHALAQLGRLVVWVAGGRDRPALIRAALKPLSEHANILDASAVVRIRIANNTLVPIAGADQGHYALDEDACGFAPSDLDAAAKDLGSPQGGERRWLLSWQAPAARGAVPGPAYSDTGVDLGSELLARFSERIGALGAVSAWPIGRQEISAPGPLGTAIVSRLFGPHLERPDGSRLDPGVLVLEVDREGVRAVGVR
jgi:hypothetical protein